MIANLCVHQSKWVAKDGEKGIAGQELYDDEHRIIAENRHGEELRPAFETGGIEFGRADFGLVDGRPQVYEINTNPTIAMIRKHPFPVRIAASRLFEEKFVAALAAIDTPAGGPPIKMKGTVLREQRAARSLDDQEPLGGLKSGHGTEDRIAAVRNRGPGAAGRRRARLLPGRRL